MLFIREFWVLIGAFLSLRYYHVNANSILNKCRALIQLSRKKKKNITLLSMLTSSLPSIRICNSTCSFLINKLIFPSCFIVIQNSRVLLIFAVSQTQICNYKTVSIIIRIKTKSAKLFQLSRVRSGINGFLCLQIN